MPTKDYTRQSVEFALDRHVEDHRIVEWTHSGTTQWLVTLNPLGLQVYEAPRTIELLNLREAWIFVVALASAGRKK
jgi:hypothetical protein